MHHLKPYFTTSIKPESSESTSLQICYYLIKSDGGADYEPGIQLFGIQADLFSGSNLIDTRSISNISSNQNEVVSLIEQLAKSTVTPVTLKDVVEDYVANKCSL